MDGPGSRRDGAEHAEQRLGAVVLLLPLLYLLAEHSMTVFLWRWSKGAVAAITLYGLFYAAWWTSYRWALPAGLHGLRKALVLVPTAALGALIPVEIALRVTDDAPYTRLDNRGRHAPDPDLGHVYVPNHVQRIQTREYSVEWRSNAQGVKADRDFGPKPAGVTRVLAVGDSFTAGDQVSIPENWPGVLQRCYDANAGPHAVEVVNAGFPGYSTINEAVWIEKFGAMFEPDVVVVAMTVNDLLENQFPLQYVAWDGAMVAANATEYQGKRYEDRQRWYSLPGHVHRSAIARMWYSSALFRRLQNKGHVPHESAYVLEPDDKARHLYTRAQEYLLRARTAAEVLGARFAVIVIPHVQQMGDLGPGLDPRVFGDHWTRFGEEQGFPVLDLFDDFRAQPDPRALYWREDSHCTAAGYRLIGERTCAFLEQAWANDR